MVEYRFRVYIELADGSRLLALEDLRLYNPEYGKLTPMDALAAVRAAPQRYGYGSDPATGMLTLGAVMAPREQVRGLIAELSSLSFVDPAEIEMG